MPRERTSLFRAHATDLEIRSDGRTVAGIAVPFDSPAVIAEPGRRFTEVFRRGSFAKTISERGPGKIKFMAQHNHQLLPIGRATLLREDTAGLYGEFRVSKTSTGDDVLELVRDGALDGLSIGFEPVQDNWSDTRDSVERVEARLREVSAVSFPAYADAVITGVRQILEPTLSATAAAGRLRLIETNWRPPNV